DYFGDSFKMQFLVLSIELFLGLLWILMSKGEPDWTFEILEVNCINNSPDLFDMSLKLKRIARGYFALEGTITVGEDLTDESRVHADLFYSPMGQQFMRTPFAISEMPISQYFNTFYKDLFLEAFNECSTNPPLKDSSETFIPPWRKTVMVLENCNLSNANMPSHMRSGYYKLIFEISNKVESTLTVLGKVESK
ncbi:hypothetical protein DOY81_001868, partial [Sarcophaga bullata]